MFLGRYQLGQTLPLLLVTKNAAGTPTAPADVPVVELWAASGKVLCKEMPILDRYKYAGTFLYPLCLGATFAAGLYRVVYHYVLGTYRGIQEDGFEVMPGGHSDGPVMSMYFYHRPQADFIIQSLGSGKIVQGRNPTV